MEHLRNLLVFTVLFYIANVTECRELSDSRMIGGAPSDISEVPYIASVLHFGEHICGGVIVSRLFVLTAAHCFKNVYSEDDIQVRVGSFRAYYSGIVLDANFYILHPDFNTTFNSIEHDVALIRLAYPLKFDENIQPAMVADYGEEPVAGKLGVVAGWERFEVTRDIAGDLRRIDVTIVDEFDCFLSYMDTQDITNDYLCATSSRNNVDACRGDVGTPLAVDGLIVGLFSWSGKCGDPTQPSVYTNLAHYYMWIDHSIKIFS